MEFYESSIKACDELGAAPNATGLTDLRLFSAVITFFRFIVLIVRRLISSISFVAKEKRTQHRFEEYKNCFFRLSLHSMHASEYIAQKRVSIIKECIKIFIKSIALMML